MLNKYIKVNRLQIPPFMDLCHRLVLLLNWLTQGIADEL